MLGSEHLNMLNRSSIQYDIYIEKYMYVAAHTTPSAKSTILRFPKGNAQKNPDIEGVGHRFKEKVYKILTIFSTV